MTNDLRQRLVGAAVITAIAAIFLPMLFDDPVHESSKAANDLVIPAPPQVAAPGNAVPATVPQMAYPSELSPTEQNGAIEKSSVSKSEDGGLNTEEALHNERLEDQKAAARMTVAELAALKDKKEREKILKDRIEKDDGALNAAKETSVADAKQKGHLENKIKDKFEIDSKIKEKSDAEKKSKEKIEVDRKDKERLAADKKVSEKLDADGKLKDKLATDKKTAEKLAKEKADYQKLAAKKAQEKALADKKVAAKLALDAKQQALDDKAAASKIAADKLVAEKAVSTAPVATRWFIRVGSYGQESNAYAFRDALRKQGYPAVVDVVKSAGKGKLYRLRVGPELSKALAEKVMKKMDADNGSKSIIELE